MREGDHCWSIATRTLESAWGRTPTDREATRYWRQVVYANRERFVLPGDADLILPGQVLIVPPVPPRPG